MDFSVSELWQMLRAGDINYENVEFFIQSLERNPYSKDYYAILLELEEHNLVADNSIRNYVEQLKKEMAVKQPSIVKEVLVAKQVPPVEIAEVLVSSGVAKETVVEIFNNDPKVVEVVKVSPTVETPEPAITIPVVAVAPVTKPVVVETSEPAPKPIVEEQNAVKEKEMIPNDEQLVNQPVKIEELFDSNDIKVVEENGMYGIATSQSASNNIALDEIGKELDANGIKTNNLRTAEGEGVIGINKYDAQAMGLGAIAVNAGIQNEFDTREDMNGYRSGLVPELCTNQLAVDPRIDLFFESIHDATDYVEVLAQENGYLITLSSKNGEPVQMLYENKYAFEQYVLPKMVVSYASNASCEQEPAIVDQDDGGKLCQFQGDVTLNLVNVPQSSIEQSREIVATVQKKKQQEEVSYTEEQSSVQTETPDKSKNKEKEKVSQKVLALGPFRNAAYTTPIILFILALIFLIIVVILYFMGV